MAVELTITFNVKYETAVDSGDQTTYTLDGYSGQVSPAPEVYVNAILIPAADYTFNVGTASVHCSITFDTAQGAADVVTCSYSWEHECDNRENVEAYEFTKPTNARSEIDVNGRNVVTEAYRKFPGFHGLLRWPYAKYAWWDTIRKIAENAGGTIDVERESLTSGLPTKKVSGLYIISYPPWGEEPGVVDVVKDITIEVVEVGV